MSTISSYVPEHRYFYLDCSYGSLCSQLYNIYKMCAPWKFTERVCPLYARPSSRKRNGSA